MNNLNKLIGRGVIFPIQLNGNGRPDYDDSLQLIESSIRMILNTAIRSRFFNENFGTRIKELLEEPNDSISKSLLKTFIVDSINTNEKRVSIESIDIVSYNLYIVNIGIKLTIRKSRIEETFIFPFYKNLI